MLKSVLILIPLMILGCKNGNEHISQIIDVEETDLVMLSKEELEQTQITLTHLMEKSFSDRVKISGKAVSVPENEITVSTPTEGYVKSIPVVQGMNIQKGMVLGIIEHQSIVELQENYLLTRTALHYGQIDKERQKSLLSSQATSEKNYLEAESNVKNLQIKLTALIQKLRLLGINPEQIQADNISSNIKITSPVNGQIKAVYVNRGKFIHAASPFLDILGTGENTFIFKVFEKDASQIKLGDSIEVYANHEPQTKLNSVIQYIGKNVNEEGYIEVVCRSDPKKRTEHGVYVNGTIKSKSGNKFVLPESSIISSNDKTYVFIQENRYTFRLRELKTGIVADGQTEVTDSTGLSNKSIVSKGAYTLWMKLKNVEE